MPLDAICLSAVVRETAAQVENTRIEKIQQPARDQVVLLLRGGRRLLLCAGATQPRLHLTEQLQHGCGGRAAAVDNKARVFFRDLRAADRQALQPGRLDERGGIAALRAFEGASGRGQVQRL